MSLEEKRAWTMLVVSVGVYAAYVSIVLRRAGSEPLTEVPYASTLLWSVGIAIGLSIVLNIIFGIFSPRDIGKKDQRDREIHRFGEYIGQSFVVVGGVSALLLALAEWDYFWIANAIYLGFVASAVLSSVAKIVAYRWGFRQW